MPGGGERKMTAVQRLERSYLDSHSSKISFPSYRSVIRKRIERRQKGRRLPFWRPLSRFTKGGLTAAGSLTSFEIWQLVNLFCRKAKEREKRKGVLSLWITPEIRYTENALHMSWWERWEETCSFQKVLEGRMSKEYWLRSFLLS